MNEIFTRTSVRQFEAKEVESEKIQGILRAGFSAPSALNQRPWKFFVVTNKENLGGVFLAIAPLVLSRLTLSRSAIRKATAFPKTDSIFPPYITCNKFGFSTYKGQKDFWE